MILSSHSRAVGPLVCSSHLTAPQGISTWISRNSVERHGRHHPSVVQFREIAFYGPNVHHLSCVWFCTLRTVARQAPLSMGFSSKNTGVGFHHLLQGIFPTQGWNLHLLHWQAGSLSLVPLGSPNMRHPGAKLLHGGGQLFDGMPLRESGNLYPVSHSRSWLLQAACNSTGALAPPRVSLRGQSPVPSRCFKWRRGNCIISFPVPRGDEW